MEREAGVARSTSDRASTVRDFVVKILMSDKSAYSYWTASEVGGDQITISWFCRPIISWNFDQSVSS